MVRLHLINFYFWPFAFIQHQHFNQSHLYQQQQQKLLNVNVRLVCWSVRLVVCSPVKPSFVTSPIFCQLPQPHFISDIIFRCNKYQKS